MKISIITATYNSAATVSDTIESVLAQTHQDIEYMIIDGASKDNTLDIIRSYEPRFNGHMRIISEPDKGIYDALNKGIEYASGDVLGFIHADDLLADSDVIAKINRKFVDTNCDMLYGDMLMVDQENKKTVRNWKSSPFDKKLLRRGWMAPHPTLYATKQLYASVGNYNLKYPICADYDFIVRAFISTPYDKISYLPENLVLMRVGGTSAQTRNFKKMMIENWHIIRANNIGGAYTLFMKKFSKLFQFL